MLRCSRCGSAKFFFTKQGDAWGDHHGCICAVCQKRLNAIDTRPCRFDIPACCPTEPAGERPGTFYPVKTEQQKAT